MLQNIEARLSQINIKQIMKLLILNFITVEYWLFLQEFLTKNTFIQTLQSAVGRSVVCDCGISCSDLLAFGKMKEIFILKVYMKNIVPTWDNA